LGDRPKKLGTPTKMAMAMALYDDHTHSIELRHTGARLVTGGGLSRNLDDAE